MRSENPISSPACRGRSNSNKTPLADTFRVSAANSPWLADINTGSARGKRTAQRTSWREWLDSGPPFNTVNPDFKASIVLLPALLDRASTIVVLPLERSPKSDANPNSTRCAITTFKGGNCEPVQMPLQNTLPLCSRKSNGTKVFHEVTPGGAIGSGECARWPFRVAYIARSKQLQLAAQR